MDQSLRDRWDRLCERIGAFKKADESDLTFEMLATMYAHPPRKYHNLDHIAQCLGVFDSVSMLAEEKDSAEFAIWMHDSVYFAERPDNEERSGDAARMIAGLLGAKAEFVERVQGLIAVTRHDRTPGRGDPALVADIDLSILAETTERYDAYRLAIRDEFAFADDAAYRAGRTAFLERMLERPNIFATALFRREYEPRAVENMRRELEMWRGG